MFLPGALGNIEDDVFLALKYDQYFGMGNIAGLFCIAYHQYVSISIDAGCEPISSDK